MSEATETTQTTTTTVAQPEAKPAAQPAAQPVATPAADTTATQETPAAGSEISYAPTGDASLDVALGYLAQNGIDAEHPAVQAASTGDFSLLKAHLAAKGATGWEAMVALGEQAFERHQSSVAEREQATAAAVHEAAGGPEAWTAISTWVSENADQAEKDAINAVLEAGDPAIVKLVIGGLSMVYRGGAEYEPAAKATQGAPASPHGAGVLTPEQYTAKVAELIRDGGFNEQVDAELRSRVRG